MTSLKFILLLLLIFSFFKCSDDLAQISEDEAYHDIDNLIDSLSSDEWQVREAAILSLAKLNDNRAILPLINCLDDPHPNVKIAALGVLKIYSDKRCIKKIKKCLRDPAVVVRIYAIDALCEIIGKKAAPTIFNLYKIESNKDVKDWAAFVLRQIDVDKKYKIVKKKKIRKKLRRTKKKKKKIRRIKKKKKYSTKTKIKKKRKKIKGSVKKLYKNSNKNNSKKLSSKIKSKPKVGKLKN